MSPIMYFIWISYSLISYFRRPRELADSILKDFNYTLSMPLDYAHVQKSSNAVLDHSAESVSEKIVIEKDVRGPLIQFTFEL